MRVVLPLHVTTLHSTFQPAQVAILKSDKAFSLHIYWG